MSLVIAVVGGLLLAYLLLVAALFVARPADTTLRDVGRLLPDLLRLIRRLAGDETVPKGVRMRLWLLLAYLAVPFDLIPDFIPVVGFADDAILVALVLRSVIRAGPQKVADHWPGSANGLRAVQVIAGTAQPPDLSTRSQNDHRAGPGIRSLFRQLVLVGRR
jgi:uncharacterized membrane protein YkvA (DUF1232 family)